MLSPSEISTSLQEGVTQYFLGERHEGLLIVAGSIVLSILAYWLWGATKTGFAAAFAATVIAAALLLAGTAGSLLVRDKELVVKVVQGIDSPAQHAVVATERERVGVIVSKYRYYRYGAAVIAALSVLGLFLSDRPWVHGVAAGLLLVVVAQVLIDHYSEQRARVYYERLSPSVSGVPA